MEVEGREEAGRFKRRLVYLCLLFSKKWREEKRKAVFVWSIGRETNMKKGQKAKLLPFLPDYTSCQKCTLIWQSLLRGLLLPLCVLLSRFCLSLLIPLLVLGEIP